jgi:hypothetical protein
VSGEWNRFLNLLGCCQFGERGKGKGEREKLKRGRVETWTWSVGRGSQQLFFISCEIVKSDRVSCFLRVDLILREFD